METYRRLAGRSSWLLSLLILCSACGGGDASNIRLQADGAAQQAPADSELGAPLAFADLPPPSSLVGDDAQARSAAALSGDWRLEAFEFSPGLPNNRVSAEGFNADYSPQWTPGDPFSGIAYACHEFLLPDYDYGDFVQLGWSDAPAQGELYIALADWQRDRWRWYRPESSALLRPSSLAPHYDAQGRLLAVVALTGSGSSTLDWISIGNQPPEAVVEVVGKQYGFGSLTATFDPSGSYDNDGSIVKYEWDWQDDGSFDQVSGAVPVQHTFSTEGSHRVRLRVTDNLGRRDGAPVELSVGGSWNRTLGGAENEMIADVSIAPDGSIWACGTVETGLDRSEMAVLRFDAAGNLLYEYYWKSSDENWALHNAQAIAVAEDGAAYVLGQSVINGATSNVIQRHKAVGELTWSRQIPATDGMLEDIAIGFDQIYLCGGKWDTNLNAPRGLYVVFDGEGNGVLGRLTNERANFSAVAWNPTGAAGGELRFCGYVRESGGDHDLLHARISFAEQFEYSAHRWGSPTVQEMGVGIALAEGELETLSMLATSVQHDLDNLRSALVRFSIDEAASVSVDTINTDPRAVCIHDGKAMLLSNNSPGASSIQHFALTPAYDGSHGYSTNQPTRPQSMESFAGMALLVGGSAVDNSGSFDQIPVSNSQVEDRTWTEHPLSYDFYVFSVVNSPANISTRQPGTLDSGGGAQDFWLNLHVPPGIDF